MPHAHASSAGEHRQRLLVFLITVAVFVVEVIGGFASNSLALLDRRGATLTDVVGIGLALGPPIARITRRRRSGRSATCASRSWLRS